MEIPTPTPSSSHACREAIRKTVERVAPPTPVDGTRVLSAEEVEELLAQTARDMEARKLARENDAPALRERVKSLANRVTKSGSIPRPDLLPPPPCSSCEPAAPCDPCADHHDEDEGTA